MSRSRRPGASGARLFTRFAHGSPGFTALARELADGEARLEPHCVLAEVVHLPQPRGGNLVTRPVLRRYETPYLGASGVVGPERIDVCELMVSVGDRVVLRSPRLGKEVRPMLSTAHHFESHDLAMYRFLCAVAQQQLPVGAFHWGVLADAPFLPRVRHGKAILFPAQWVLDTGDQRVLEHASRGLRSSEVASARRRVFAEVARIRAARGWPRWIVCAESDHELVVDLDSELSVESMVHFLRGRRTPRVIEMIPAPHELCATGPGGAYLHQIVVPFVRAGAATDAPPPRATPAMPARRCHPGSRWVFAKLYGGPIGLEATLRDVIGPLARTASAAERWFFVRYSDPEYHLRVRFEGEPARLASELVPRLWEQLRPAADDGIVWRMQLETYEREVERYGGEHGMLLSESVFAADSEAALAILEQTAPGDERRWWSTLLGVDALMADFRLGLRERLALVTKARDELGATLGMNLALKGQLGVKFRHHREALGALLDAGHADAPGRAVFTERSRRLMPVADELCAADRAGRLTLPIPSLVSSYIHMHVNRMLSTNHQRQELVLYDLLRRYYDGRVSRAD